MPSFNRRHFGKLIAGAAAAVPLAAARRTAATDEHASAVAAAAPLTPEQMAQYRKTLPDQLKALDKLHSFELGYGYEPDFIFRAAGPDGNAAPVRAHRAAQKKGENG